MKVAIAGVVFSMLATCSVPNPSPAATPINSWLGIPLAPNVSCQGLCSSYNVQPYVRTRSQYGLGCMGNVPPGTKIPTVLPPESYLVADIGKSGVPTLTARELRTAQHYALPANSKTLRIVWVSAAG